jgi:DNA-binding CsgD family transcriptional regulator
MVGRELELAQVRSALLSEAGAGVLLAGASGVGKTRLADEAAAEVAAAGLRVVRVSPTWAGRHLRLATLGGRAAPQGAAVHGTALHGPGLHGSGLHGSGLHGSGVHDDAGGLDLRRLLGAEVRGRGVLVLVDDVHLLDASTAELLLELARLRRARLLLVLNTEHQPPRQITTMWKDQHLTRMELRLLDAFVMRRLASAMLGGNLQYASAVRLTKLAHGNPLLLRELVYAAIDQGVLAKTAGRWVLAKTVPLSPRLRELLGAKVGQLSAPARRALELTVLAEPAPLAVLEALAGADGLAELEAAELVRVPPEAPRPQVRLSHPLIGEVVRQQLPALRRRELMRGWVLACSPPASTGSAEWLQHVAWQLDAGLVVDEQTLLAAARLAYLARDLAGASRFAEAAWHTYGTVAAAAQCAGAMVGLGRAEGAYAVLDAAVATHGDHPQLAVARARGYLLQARLDEAQALIAGVPGPDGALCGAMVAYFRGHFEDCSRQCEPLLADPDPARRTEAVIFAMAALCHQGRAADALQLAATLQRDPPAGDRFVLHDDSFEELVAAAHADLGNLAEASRILGRSFEHAMSAGLPRLDAQKGLALGFVLLERGRPLDALRLFDLGPLFQVGWQLWHVRAQVNTLLAACLLQDQAAADRAAERLPPVTETHFTCYHLVALAWQASLRSDWDAARKHLVLAADTAASHGGYGDVAIAVHEMARLGLAEASRPYWGVPVQGPLQRARLDYARALATGDRQLLSAAASAFEVMGAHLYSAEAFAELARLYRRLGQRPLATEAARRAHGLKARCQGAETPALCLIDEVEPLSRREREIAVLAARGLDDRTIAERLTLSVRTVGNHLHRAYQKLGINSRRELRMALASDRLGA